MRAGVDRHTVPAAGELRGVRYGLALAALAGTYVGTARLGIDLDVSEGVITPVWAPTGISLAALVLFGPRLWPAVALGAFAANATGGEGALVAAGIAVGNTLEAVLGAYLLRRVGFRAALDRVRDVLALLVLAAGVSTLVAATNGVAVLSLAGSGASFGADWLLWWFGDAIGDLLVAPLLLVAWTVRHHRPSRERMLEGAALLAALAGVSAALFLAGGWRYPYVIFPLLLWAALRFRQLGAAASSFVVGVIGTWGAVAGEVPIAMTGATERVQIVQALVAVLAVSLLVVGATLAERQAAGDALGQAVAQLLEAQALTHIGSWEWDIGADTVTWSDELYRIWGLDPGRFGASYEAYLATVHPEDREGVKAAIRRSFESGRFEFEHRIVRPDGAERAIHSRGRLERDAGGAPVRMLGTAQDVTDRKAVEAERERLLAEERAQTARLRELDRMKDTFLASVSHELRTPLTSIIGFLGLLRDESRGGLTEEQRSFVDIAWRNVERLQRLVGDLLFVAHADAGEPLLEEGGVDLRALVSAALDAARLQAEETGVELVLAGDDVPPLRGDAARLAQLVEHLVVNAVKFSAAGGRVEVRTAAEDGRAVLEVADDGIGVPLDQQEHVFQRFFRGSNANDRAIQGAGLGLWIARRITEVHGGWITFESVEGAGTTVRVELPLPEGPADPDELSDRVGLPL